MTWAFDANAIIYAADVQLPDGQAVLRLMHRNRGRLFGSTLLIPEVLIMPRRDGESQLRLQGILAQLDLVDVGLAIADGAVVLGARYGLRTVDAVHLATAVHVGADCFVTNNTRDFDPGRIADVDIVTPAEL